MDYRRLCQVFIAEIRRLRQENESLGDALDWALNRATEQERWRRHYEECCRQERERKVAENPPPSSTVAVEFCAGCGL